MKTYLNLKTNQRLPQHGCDNRFDPGRTRIKWWIRGEGWKSSPLSHWKAEEIPDLPTNWTLTQFREYAAQYGRACAQEFIDTCDMMKPRQAALRLDPHFPDDETALWAAQTFKLDARACYVPILAMFGRFFFDIIAFEGHLSKAFGYDMNADISMRDFMAERFGEENAARFERIFLAA